MGVSFYLVFFQNTILLTSFLNSKSPCVCTNQHSQRHGLLLWILLLVAQHVTGLVVLHVRRFEKRLLSLDGKGWTTDWFPTSSLHVFYLWVTHLTVIVKISESFTCKQYLWQSIHQTTAQVVFKSYHVCFGLPNTMFTVTKLPVHHIPHPHC